MRPFDSALVGAVLVIMTPLVLAATGELVSELAGVVNVGLEGMMLTGAFTAFALAAQTGSRPVGIAAGVAGGLLCGVVMAGLSVQAGANQILVGIGINLLAVGLVSFFNSHIYNGEATTTITTLGPIAIPGLSDFPLGRALFGEDIGVYASLVLLVAVAFALLRTDWGLAIRAVGEDPFAADAAGINVTAMRWTGVLIAAGFAGLAGAYLVIGQTGVFTDGMTGGRGYLALAAVIVGRWKPSGILAACGLFAVADALQLRLQSTAAIPSSVWVAGLIVSSAFVGWTVVRRSRRGPGRWRWTLAGALSAAGFCALAIAQPPISLSTYVWQAFPYLLAIVALAIAKPGRGAIPAKLTIPYVRTGG